ncbi:DDE Tnp IS1595 domain-containing protein [Aphis craccivora]|uniref:DDE Tnp IS1595 domain-containing protein n=1 Tax=Aphis craccivora TaxID=307492 RepID=A0A6G0VTG6_APHCR|nr:DDE Tnp IS1595 domain-containing protein [Aphis craccivora]
MTLTRDEASLDKFKWKCREKQAKKKIKLHVVEEKHFFCEVPPVIIRLWLLKFMGDELFLPSTSTTV